MKIVTLNLDEVTSFGKDAFLHAYSLETLNAPKATYFEDWAFCFAHSLKEINAPMAKSFGNMAFCYAPQHIKDQIKELVEKVKKTKVNSSEKGKHMNKVGNLIYASVWVIIAFVSVVLILGTPGLAVYGLAQLLLGN